MKTWNKEQSVAILRLLVMLTGVIVSPNAEWTRGWLGAFIVNFILNWIQLRRGERSTS